MTHRGNVDDLEWPVRNVGSSPSVIRISNPIGSAGVYGRNAKISEAFENAGKYGHSAMLYEMFDHTGTAGDRPAAYDSAPPWQVRRRESSPHKLAAISEEQR
jgi:hypothetical protein